MPQTPLRTRLGAAFKAASKAMRFGGTSYGGYGGHWAGRWTTSSAFDYAGAVGDMSDNSIVAATLGWIGRTFPEAPVRVMEARGKGEESIPGHPFTLKMMRPNPYYSGSLMWTPLLMSYILDGNAYLLKERTNGGDVLNLWYVPHWQMEPRWPTNGSQYISHYDYRVDGQTERKEIEDVVHLRNGLDPKNPRKGLSQLKSAIRLVYTDDEADRYSSAMLRNRGTPGAVISPKTADQSLKEEEAAFVKQQYVEKTTGEHQGEPLISLAAIDVNFPSFSPDQMNVRGMRQTPEERISALIGIPAIVVGLGAGLERSTYSNTEQAYAAAYRSYLIPTQRVLGEELTTQLLPDFGGTDKQRVGFDYSDVRALQQDETEVAKIAQIIWSSGIADRAEVREQVGLEVRPEDKGIFFMPRGSQLTHGEVTELPPTPESPVATPTGAVPGASTNGTNGKKPTNAAALAALTKGAS